MILSKKIKIIIDTNVFISGLLFGGTPKKVLDLWSTEKTIFCVSPDLKAEVFLKLKNKFKVGASFLDTLDQFFQTKTEYYLPKKKIDLLNDKKDNFLLELADESKADLLVTGDKELLNLKKFNKTLIVKPKELLTKINKSNQ